MIKRNNFKKTGEPTWSNLMTETLQFLSTMPSMPQEIDSVEVDTLIARRFFACKGPMFFPNRKVISQGRLLIFGLPKEIKVFSEGYKKNTVRGWLVCPIAPPQNTWFECVFLSLCILFFVLSIIVNHHFRDWFVLFIQLATVQAPFFTRGVAQKMDPRKLVRHNPIESLFMVYLSTFGCFLLVNVGKCR